jgi:hypothetical protein
MAILEVAELYDSGIAFLIAVSIAVALADLRGTRRKRNVVEDKKSECKHLQSAQ